MTHPIRAVIFDWAGTMIDFGCMAPVDALLQAFAAEGVAITADEARRHMGRAKKDHLVQILKLPRVAEAWRSAKGGDSTAADVRRLFEALEPLMETCAARCSDLIPGAAALVADLRADGVKIGSGTGYTRTMMSAILPAAARQGYSPEVVICAGDTPSGRPSPLMVWAALIRLDAWPAAACVKIDDAEVGIAEGRAAGCWTIGVAASGNGVGLPQGEFQALAGPARAARVEAAAEALRDAGADYVVETVADARPTLADIARRIALGERPA
jgi:phosphonoacetaldehyde hydrolase